MPIDFPSNPSSGETYSYAGQQWQFNGVAWDKIITANFAIFATTSVTGATYAALAFDYYIGVSYAGPVTITLPANPETGREIVVKDESGNAGGGTSRRITIVGATAAHTIDNQSSAIINLDNAGLHFIYRSGWRII